MAVLPALILAACGGSSSEESGAGNSPGLVSAIFVGAGPAPAAGEFLLLQMSDDVVLPGDDLLDDDDFVLSAGTLGTVTQQPAIEGSRSVRVTLGWGVSFVPGQTTIAFSEEVDALTGTDGSPVISGQAQTIIAGDAEAPSILELTIEGIDSQLNGSGPAGGILQVPRSGFRIDVQATDRSSTIDAGATLVTADVTVAVDGLPREAGQQLGSALQASLDGDWIRLLVPDDVRFPVGNVEISVVAVDSSGRSSEPRSFLFRAVGADDLIRPFEDGQAWLLDFSRDVESYDVVQTGGLINEVEVVEGANGRSDLEELMLVCGLLHSSPIPDVNGALNSNAAVMDLFRLRLLTDLDRLFGDVDVEFRFDFAQSFPPGTASLAYDLFGFSQICIAGSPTADGKSGTLGAALFDRNNQRQDNNCLSDFQGLRLGVFLHTAVRYGFNSGSTSTWRLIFDPLAPDNGGLAIGADPQDKARLEGTLADSRTNSIYLAINALARLTAVVTAHECGHSMGLVANGPMPAGLYGGDALNFPLSQGLSAEAAQGHIQNTALFPIGSQNVMSPAIDFESSLSPDTSFNSLNRAYLRERALYDR